MLDLKCIFCPVRNAITNECYRNGEVYDKDISRSSCAENIKDCEFDYSGRKEVTTEHLKKEMLYHIAEQETDNGRK